ncbi:opioid growth factor receptor conserved region-domain-containing protein [Truncatella angustata]|uniref:Opioid growth factor receptor conserved region-domain-containing protein n=1 Tax=Truncatella angustata TaxID=152316 RepID=A0A9P8UBG6_9PEZI|nr:opioid growth factor receptor conserved region-domain-containing protein [Truncatella angustata]KAH6646037.1 opioid growth factor receptor conserved region-domain-containing protein [Truncatella angustata]
MLFYFYRPPSFCSTLLRRRLVIIDRITSPQSLAKMSVPTQQLPSEPACRRLVQFYELQGADNRGRRLQQIIEWSDNRLESCHDYIQTLFPLPEESMFADAPVIDEETYLYWRQHASLRQNLRRAFERILTFYGFEISWDEADGGGADRKPHISEKRGARSNLARWVRPMDHNHLRITRILRSLRVLGMEAEAREFHQAPLERLPEIWHSWWHQSEVLETGYGIPLACCARWNRSGLAGEV